MFNKQLILKLKKILTEKNLTYGEFYFFLASFMMYFTEPLVNEKWNNFPYKINNKIISLEEGLLMTDEEKNTNPIGPTGPIGFTDILLETKKQLILQFPTLYKNKQSYVIVKQYKENVLLPYSKINLKDTKRVNHFGINDSLPFSVKIKNEKLTNELVKKHIEKLEKNINYCKMCNYKKIGKKKLPFKTLNKHQTLYFCSLECLNNYNF